MNRNDQKSSSTNKVIKKKLQGMPVQIEEVDPDKPQTEPNRRDKRLRLFQHSVPRVRTGSKTGQPPWFRKMKFEQEQRKALTKVRTDLLEPAIGEVAKHLHKAGYDTVWKVSQETDVNRFLVHGMRRAQLEKAEAYLTRMNVPLKWTVADPA